MANDDDATAAGTLHILMFPFLAFGHISPFIQLSHKLSAADRGIQITFLSTPANLPRISSLIPSSSSIRLISLPLPSVAGLPSGVESTSDLPPDTAELLKVAVDGMQPQVAALLADLRPEIVFFDFAQPWIPSIAHPLGVKTLFFSVFSAANIAYFGVPPRRSNHVAASITDELRRPPAGFPASTALSAGVPAYQAADFAYVFRSFGGVPVSERVLACLTGCSALVLKTCTEMESPYLRYIESQLRKPLLLAGPVVPESPSGLLGPEWTDFLDRFPDGSVVFCSFGSETSLTDDGVRELLFGLEMTKMPFLAVLNGAVASSAAAAAAAVTSTGGNGLIREGWAPQQQILAHKSVGCYVCHAGMSSLVEAVITGCRLVLLPQKGDQYLNARLFAGDLGIGVEVERGEDGAFRREAVRDAVVTGMEEKWREKYEKWRGFFMDGEVQERYLVEFIGKLKQLAYDKLS